MQYIYLIAGIGALLFGCSSVNDDETQGSKQKISQVYQSNTLHGHVEKLVRQLLSTSQSFDPSSNIAVGTILPTTHQSGQQLPSHTSLGLQIQESVTTFVTQAGLTVVEYKTMPSIKIKEQADEMLSRNIEELSSSIAADYFLTGTYTLQETSTLINIRLIKIPENTILAAATDYVPNDAMWSSTKVTLKNNQIYRNGY
ncbi:FlgO family outer membrane protein [Paraglaciecola sp. 2405UD69-4]|uniref:FlgO family outer membrane protein n=1 Tax=Paraglaciecola sp. 2405UD69-4 TaxID=3391836 RepID=UPI0039C9EEC9